MGITHMHSKFGMHSFSNCVCDCKAVCGSQIGGHCNCNFRLFSRLIDMAKSILCSKLDGAQWHGKECLFGSCVNCGVNFLPLCPKEEERDSTSIVKWKHFAMDNMWTKKDEKRKS